MKDKNIAVTVLRLEREIRKLKREKLLLEKQLVDQGKRHKLELKTIMETIDGKRISKLFRF